MSQITHNISFPNDGLGDPLREAFSNQNTMNTELYATKVDKVVGKELSTNDFTNDEKAKLSGISAGAEVNVQPDWEQNDNTQDDYIKNKPSQVFASVGYFDHNDLATHTTPISISTGVNTKLTNDAAGPFTDLTKNPYGVLNIWNTATNQFDFSSLDVGDTLDLRVDGLVTTTGTNKTFKIFLKLGIGTPSEYTTLVGSSEFKTAVTDENVVQDIGFYIGSEDIRTAPAELYVLLDTTGSIKVNGWYTRIIRKSINIISIVGGEDKLDKDVSLYLSATLPLDDSDNLLVNQSGVWKVVDKSELGGGDEFIYNEVKWKTCLFNSLNTWRTPSPYPDFYDTETFASHGTGTTPTDGGAGLYASWTEIPTGYLIVGIELNVNLKVVNVGSTTSDLQIYIDRSEVAVGSIGVSSSNVLNLVNQSVNLPVGSDRLKFIYPLTVAANTAPALAKSFIRIWARETTTTSLYYSLGFNIIFKKI